MDKKVLSTLLLNETIAFLLIEPLFIMHYEKLKNNLILPSKIHIIPSEPSSLYFCSLSINP